MRKGILEYCILLILSRATPMLRKSLRSSNARMIVVEGTLYPILTRQKNQGLLSYRWEESPQGLPANTTSITTKAARRYPQLDVSWDELIAQIAQIRGR